MIKVINGTALKKQVLAEAKVQGVKVSVAMDFVEYVERIVQQTVLTAIVELPTGQKRLHEPNFPHWGKCTRSDCPTRADKVSRRAKK